jgi:hypothetical protein
MPQLEGVRDYVRSPLGIIGLFVVLVYGLGIVAFGVSSSLDSGQRWVLVLFVVGFPCVAFGAFLYLVLKAPRSMYGPRDFRSDEAFQAYTVDFAVVGAQIEIGSVGLQVDVDPSEEPTELPERPAGADIDFTQATLDDVLLAVYFSQQGVFLGHIAHRRPPDGRRPEYEVAIFLTGSDDAWKAQRATFYFGSGWRSRFFTARPDESGRLGVVVRAYAGFLALCEVVLEDGSTILLNHYCNLEAADLVS